MIVRGGFIDFNKYQKQFHEQRCENLANSDPKNTAFEDYRPGKFKPFIAANEFSENTPVLITTDWYVPECQRFYTKRMKNKREMKESAMKLFYRRDYILYRMNILNPKIRKDYEELYKLNIELFNINSELRFLETAKMLDVSFIRSSTPFKAIRSIKLVLYLIKSAAKRSIKRLMKLINYICKNIGDFLYNNCEIIGNIASAILPVVGLGLTVKIVGKLLAASITLMS